ncbi:MAG: hypothetical protein KDC53_00205, partial [Saprospiraceae bacterium]|nr:hypothetical protein [Saprospiraceae bacterium]
FKVFRHTDDPRSLTDDMVSCVLETRSGEIWAGTRRHGINIKAPGDIGFKHLTIDNSGLPSNEIIALHQDKNDNIWIGTWGQGLVIFNPQDKTWHHFEPDENDSLAILSRFVADIFEASDGNVWLATVKGISVLDSDNWAKGKFKNYSHHPQEPNSLSFPRVSAIHQDRSGNIWVGTLGGGLDLYDPVHNQFVHHRHDPYDPLSLSNEQVNAIFEDSQGRVWVGTFGGGLNLLHKDHSGFRHFNTVDGLANDEVMGIVNDGKGQLWVATGRGLSVLNLDELTFNNIYAYDGLSGNEMLERSIYYSERTGTIYCGSRSGLTIIDPNALSQNNVVPNIVIQSVQKYDEHGIPVEEDIFRGPATDELFLTHADNIITIEFVALSFSHPQENQYAYKLEGVNDDWIQLGSKREVTFTSLPPGEYQFQVIGSNNDQIWNTGGAQLTIFVSPPWWNTWWAWTLLAVLVGLVIYFLIRYRDSRHAEIEESRRLKYLNDAMSEFIATVSHELRTPLTSIMGFSKLVKKRLTERIYPFADLTDTKREQTAQQVISNMDIVILESERLTALINEVLDLARIEAGKVEWNLEVVSLDEIIHQAGEATETIFLAKQMHLDIYVEPDLPGIYADRNRLLQVLINLFSNSVKFSDGNCVECRAYSNGAYVEVSIKDSGIGIRKEDLSTIFEKFGQVKGGHNLSKPGGSGLGLPISREIIEHHGGKIWVVSTVGEGSVFYFTLPVIKKASLLQIND